MHAVSGEVGRVWTGPQGEEVGWGSSFPEGKLHPPPVIISQTLDFPTQASHTRCKCSGQGKFPELFCLYLGAAHSRDAFCCFIKGQHELLSVPAPRHRRGMALPVTHPPASQQWNAFAGSHAHSVLN